MRSAATRLKAAGGEVDALNVYPLPDGDTGRNLMRTVDSALARAEQLGEGAGAGAMWRAFADGSLRGAHGNSGVILSQIFRGFADTLGDVEAFDGAQLREALAGGARRAGSAVAKPARGTMLTFCEEVANASAGGGGDLLAVLGVAMEAAGPALERTMRDNAMNAAAGVVDAGAYGLWLLLAGTHESALGEPRQPPRLRRDGARPAAVALSGDEVASWSGGACVQFVVCDAARPVEELRREIEALGTDSVLVVGDQALVKVHAHALQPEPVLAVGRSAGTLEDVTVEDFDEMVAAHERATGIVLASPPRPLAAISVVPGPGIAAAFRSFGIAAVRGAAGANPSVGEIADAISRANAHRVIVLPNDKNVILAAKEAAKLSSCPVDVIETTDIAGAVAALPYFEPEGEGDAVVAKMREAASSARSLEVTRATRDVTIDGIAVRGGDAIALVDGRVVARADEPVAALAAAAGSLDGVGILTVFVGADVDEATATRAAAALREACPEAEVEVKDGGQPHYPFVVAAE